MNATKCFAVTTRNVDKTNSHSLLQNGYWSTAIEVAVESILSTNIVPVDLLFLRAYFPSVVQWHCREMPASGFLLVNAVNV